MDAAFRSATRLVRALRAKKIGALELLDLYAARIARAPSIVAMQVCCRGCLLVGLM